MKPTFTTTTSAAEERERERAEATVRPLAQLFVNAMIHRANFERAHDLLAPQFQTGSVSEWQSGQHLPLAFSRGSSLGSTTVAYSGPTEVGLVVAASAAGVPDSDLVALRLDKQGTRWLIDYIHKGHSSSRIDATNYAPPGFLPGSHRESASNWLILVLGLAAIIAAAALLDRWLSRPRGVADGV